MAETHRLMRRMITVSILLVLFLCLAVPYRVNAQDEKHEVVRVGWYESPFNYKDSNGRRTGYAYEYQQKIAAYTGWEYEYVEASWPELLEMVKSGEIDLMSDVSYTEERAEEMQFSSLPMGAEAYYVFIAADNNEIKPGDFASLNGKKVGINKDSFQEKLFLEWAEKNEVDAEVVELTSSEDESIQMLSRGEIDAFVTIDAYGDTSVYVPVFKVGESEFYFTVTNDRTDLLDELDVALSKIQDENRQYNQQLYDKYVRAIGTNAFLASDEAEWLSQHGAISVGYLDGSLPFCDTDKSSGALTGALSEYLEIASDSIQNAEIEYTTIPYQSINDAIDALKAGEVDCVFLVNLSAYDGEELGVSVTSSVMDTEMYAAVRQSDKLGALSEEKMTAAVVEGDLNTEVFLKENFPEWGIEYCKGNEDGFRMVADGKADCMLFSNYRIAQTEMLREQYKLVPLSTGKTMNLSFATRRTDGELYHILNKTSDLVPRTSIDSALLAWSGMEYQFSLREFIKDNLLAVIATIIVIAALVVLLLIRRANRMKKEYEEKLKLQDALSIALSEAEEANEKLRALSETDPMTGVRSKHGYMVQEKEIDKAIDEGGFEEFAVVVCDVNGLKKINDTYGHKAGDEYIQEASKMICDIFQHSPVYRVGGDEFTVILTGRDYSIRKELMITLHDRSVDHINAGGAVVSGGLSEFRPGEDKNTHDVFQRADELMYEEKTLLKSLGAVTRDDAEDEAQGSALLAEINAEQPIINIKRHILIVDDELVNRKILGLALSSSYELLYASDGYEALEQVRAHKDELALILLDLLMPRMSGMEVLRILKNDDDLKDIPVIVVTADQEAELECLSLGAMDFIPKPYPKPEIMQARVNKCIELSEDRNIIQSTERDSLTNLFNIDYFMNYVKLYDQHFWDKPMDAVVMDINEFHLINERYGRQYGDIVLRRVGQRIRKIARQVGGVGCRYGADTFMLYCPHIDDYEEMLKSVSEELEDYAEFMNRVRLRMGVYSNVDKEQDIDRRFENARAAANKVRGNLLNPVGVYDDEMHEQELYKARLLEEFRPALEHEDFKVYFQPKFDIRPDKPLLTSAEALVRWVHPEFGIISPADFIPMLEENGLIIELDKYVWRRTAARIRDWKDRLGYYVPVSVNVSRVDMMVPNMKDILKEIVDEYDISTDDIILEITESTYMGDSDHIISAVKDLRGMGMGFRIEMDDFGTGYSSLGMLTKLPLDALKLDMSFVRSAFGETKDLRIIELIIDIADYLGVPVVAEGVETEEQYLTLREMGCDLVQGYYFSKPVPPEEFDRFIIERKQQ